MAQHAERSGRSLLDFLDEPLRTGARVRRVAGILPEGWPHRLELAGGTALVHEDGTVLWEPGPAGGEGPRRFGFTLWDGTEESPAYEAEILLAATPAPAARLPAAGWNPGHDAGTRADYLVDAAAAPGGDGSPARPFASLAAAIARAAADGRPRTIRLRAGTYREAVSTAGFQGTIARYGTERAVISGAEPLGGWTRCGPADRAEVGPDFAAVWKTALPVRVAPNGELRALNLCAGGRPMPFAQSRPASGISRYFFTYDRAFHRTGRFLTAGSGIAGILDRKVLPAFTAAQLRNAFAVLHIKGNTVRIVPVTGADPAAGTLTVGGNHPPDPDRPWYSLVNLLPAMQPGEWGYIDRGDGTATIYCRPEREADLGAIEYSAREYCINYSSRQAGPVTLEGLEIVQAASGRPSPAEAKVAGICVGTLTDILRPGEEGSDSRRRQPITIRHCCIGRNMGAGGDFPRGALYLYKADNAVVENVTLEWCGGSFGMMLHGAPGSPITGCRISRVHGRFTAQAPARFFGCVGTIHEFSLYESCGFGGHTNQFNWYAGCDRNLNFGIRTRDCIGYVTWQDASRTHFLFCDFMASADEIETGGRAMADQNGRRNADVPAPGAPSHVIHCRFVPHPARLGRTNSVILGKRSLPGMAWSLVNCIVHGGGMQDAYDRNPARRAPGTEGVRAGNLYTALAFWQKPANGWGTGPGEALAPLDRVYRNAARGDFSPAPQSPLLALPGTGWGAALADLRAQFPGYPFDRDLAGRRIDPARPGFIGPLADPSALR